jgi:hypothetical protein
MIESFHVQPTLIRLTFALFIGLQPRRISYTYRVATVSVVFFASYVFPALMFLGVAGFLLYLYWTDNLHGQLSRF